jgi:hypothetical protein
MSPPPLKVRKQPTALESRLTELRGILNNLSPSWSRYDPDCFMEEMRRLRQFFNNITPNQIEQYIEDGMSKTDLNVLEIQEGDLENALKDATNTPSIGSQPIKRSQSVHQSMLTYLKRVQRGLKGPSETHSSYSVVADFRPEALVAQSLAKPPPREFADYNQWRKHQEKPNAILCLRPADQKGLPLPLMHSAFCTFTRHFYEPLLDDHTPKYLTMAEKLCKTMPSAFSSEPERRDAFEAIFQPLDETLEPHVEYSLSGSISTSVKESGSRPDIAKTIFKGSLVLMLQGFKLEEGDIYMQICRAFEVLSEQAKFKHLLKFGNPVFLLCVLGMYQMFIPNNTF